MTAAKWRREPIEGEGQSPPVPALPAGHRLRGVSTLVGADGATSAQWLKTTAIGETPEDLLSRLLSEIPARVPSRGEPIPAPPSDEMRDDVLAVYPMGDPHVGMLSWGAETGADFDLQIAEDVMVRAAEDLVARGPRSREALLANLGDYFHSDNDAQHTTHGTHALDVDGRAAKVLIVGLRIFVVMIDALLRRHEIVHVRCLIGNHDGYTAIMLAIALAAHYRDEPRVQIPVDPRHRMYFQFGRNLIGMTHGDRAKGDSLESIMASEQSKAWGETRHRYWLCGHVHHSTVLETRGCRIETFRTLAARDSWHARQGYQSGRDMHRITLHREHGEIGREVASVAWLLRDAPPPAPPSSSAGHAPQLDSAAPYPRDMTTAQSLAKLRARSDEQAAADQARALAEATHAADVSGLDYDDDVTTAGAQPALPARPMSNVEAARLTARHESTVRAWRERRPGATAEDYAREHVVTL